MSVLASFEPELVAGTEVKMIQLWTPAEIERERGGEGERGGHCKLCLKVKLKAMHGDL